MEEKLFLKLRERYSEYGLGDELLKDYSKSVCSFFNLQEDDVMDAFVERQSDALKSIQKTIDRRVTEALKKVTKVSASELELKTQLAASVFATLAEHKGTGVLEYLTKWTIETTNDIFKGIGTVEYKTDKEIEIV